MDTDFHINAGSLLRDEFSTDLTAAHQRAVALGKPQRVHRDIMVQPVTDLICRVARPVFRELTVLRGLNVTAVILRHHVTAKDCDALILGDYISDGAFGSVHDFQYYGYRVRVESSVLDAANALFEGIMTGEATPHLRAM